METEKTIMCALQQVVTRVLFSWIIKYYGKNYIIYDFIVCPRAASSNSWNALTGSPFRYISSPLIYAFHAPIWFSSWHSPDVFSPSWKCFNFFFVVFFIMRTTNVRAVLWYNDFCNNNKICSLKCIPIITMVILL